MSWPGFIDELTESTELLSDEDLDTEEDSYESMDESLSSEVDEECKGYSDADILLEILLETKSKSNSNLPTEDHTQSQEEHSFKPLGRSTI